MEQEVEVHDSLEPSNLIWEHMKYSNTDVCKNKLVISSLVLLSIVIILLIFIFLKNSATQSLLRYPNNINCASVSKLARQEKQYEDYAEIDK